MRRKSWTSLFTFVFIFQKQLFELEDRFKKAMMSNAQLDNEKQKLRWVTSSFDQEIEYFELWIICVCLCVCACDCRYEVDIMKDRFDDLEENHIEVQRELREKSKVRIDPPPPLPTPLVLWECEINQTFFVLGFFLLCSKTTKCAGKKLELSLSLSV